MNMTLIDWLIVAALVAVLLLTTFVCRKLIRSVADFLAAGRCAGRYIVAAADGIAGLGAISVMAYFEKYYQAGFSIQWWSILTLVIWAVIPLTGWFIYRFRQTRAMTLGQFFEIRYTKKFRVFAGILGFFSGIVNFGIFPAVGTRFFIYCCGFPASFSFYGYEIQTYPVMMAVLLLIALFFVFSGGQVSVILTDFLQGVYTNIMFVVMIVVVFCLFDWSQIVEGLKMAPPDASLLHPMHTGRQKDFNVWFELIAVFGVLYNFIAWQGNQGYNVSAKTPHEARMAKVWSCWRMIPQWLFFMILPICAYIFMHHPDFSAQSARAKSIIATIPNDQIQEQMTVPLALADMLPKGILGGFIAVMVAAFLSTHTTYLHSWGSIFIQDVILPFRKTPFKPKEHIWLLRWSILGVALFIYMFSLIFRQTEYIFMFFAITGAIFTGGAGSAIIGGLYWKRGSSAAAWSALIIGAVLSVSVVVINQIHEIHPFTGRWMSYIASQNSMVLSFYASAVAIAAYILISLLGKKTEFNMDKMLHRSKYAIADDTVEVDTTQTNSMSSKILRVFGVNREFSRGDKTLYMIAIGWNAFWVVIFIVGTIYNVIFDVNVESWVDFWLFYVIIYFVVGIVVTIWITVGGINNVKDLFKRLSTAIRNDLDDGTVVDHHSLGETVENQSYSPVKEPEQAAEN